MILTRQPSTTQTFGELTDDDGKHVCFTIELPWLYNHPMKSCVPTGTYQVNTYFSPSHGFNVWRLADVADRSEIEIHPANFASQLLGCIGVGSAIDEICGVPAVLDSQVTFKMLLSVLPDSFTLTIQ